MKRIISSLIITLLLTTQTAFAASESRQEEYLTQLLELGILEIPTAEISDEVPLTEFLRMMLNNFPGFNPEDLPFELPSELYTNIDSESSNAPYIYTALELGLIDMPESKIFNGSKKIKRFEALSMTFDLYGIAAPKSFEKKTKYYDVHARSMYYPYVTRAVDLELMEPKARNMFGINKQLTYGDAAQLLIELNVVLQNQAQPTEILVMPTTPGIPEIENIDTLADVYNKIQDYYVYDEEVDYGKLTEGAIKGMVRELGDSYSVYNSPEETDQFTVSTNGKFEGVGMWIEESPELDYIQVAGVIPNSPAEEANLKVGDKITKVNGESARGWSTQEIASKVRGPEGTTVLLTIRKHVSGNEVVVKLERKKIEISFVSGELLEGKYAYIDISQFPQSLSSQFQEVIDETVNASTQGIILDVRNNPGGYVTAAEDLLEFFLDEGDIMYYLDYKSGDRFASATGPATLGDYPLVVIIDESSASASEIIAAALKDHEKATIVGKKSFGKGVAQHLFYYDDGSSLKLTVAEWVSPNKHRINLEGIEPDVEVEDNIKTKSIDEAVQAAISEINKMKAKKAFR